MIPVEVWDMSALREGKRKINGTAKKVLEFFEEGFGKYVPSTIIYEVKGDFTDVSTNIGVGAPVRADQDWKQQIIHFLLI